MTLTLPQLQEAIGRSAACGGVTILVFCDDPTAVKDTIRSHTSPLFTNCETASYPNGAWGIRGNFDGPWFIEIHPESRRAEVESMAAKARSIERGKKEGPLTVRETVALAILSGLCANGYEVNHPGGMNGFAFAAADEFLHISEIHNGSPFKSMP